MQQFNINNKILMGLSLLFFLFIILNLIIPVIADINGGEGPFSSPEGQLVPLWVNLTRDDMFFADGNDVYIVANFSCSGTSVCNSTTQATANFSQIGGSGTVDGLYKTNSSDASWVLFEFNDTVNFTAIGTLPFSMSPMNVTVNATDGNGTDSLDELLDAPVVLVNMTYPPGCPPPNENVPLPPMIPLNNGTMVNISGCYQCPSSYRENAWLNTTNATDYWMICGPTFGGSTTNFTEVASTGNFSNFHLVLDVPGRGRINFTENVSFTSQQHSQAIMEFAVKGIMSSGRIGMNESEWNGSSTRPNLNLSAELTIYNVSQGLDISGVPQIFRYDHNSESGSPCPLEICSDFSWDGENITFTVTSWSDYGLSDAINVSLNTPSDNDYSNTRNVNFTFIPTWSPSVTMENCTLYGNFTGNWEGNQTNQTVLVNDTTNRINNTLGSDGAYIWNVYCYDTTNQYDFYSSNWTTIIDTSLPNWSDNKSSPSSPSSYSSGQEYQFNITWSDDNLDTVQIEHNFTGSSTPHNDSFTGKNGDEYYFNVSDLASGIYVWRSFANDTAGNTNVTNQWVFVVIRATPSFSSSVTSPINYETASDYSGSESNSGDTDCSYTLLRNGTQISTGSSVSDTTILGVGAYNYTYNTTGCENYTAAQDEEILVVNQKTPTITITGVTNGTYPQAETVYWGSDDINGLTIIAERNDSNIDSENNTQVILEAELYNYTVYTNGNENYTTSLTTVWNNVSRADPSSGMTLTLDGDSSSSQVRIYSNSTDIQSSESNTGDEGCEYVLVQNGTVISNGTKTLAARAYNFTYNTTGCANYTFGSKEIILTVNRGLSNISLFIDGTEGNKNVANNTGVNITIVNNVSSTIVNMTTNRTGWSQSSNVTPYENTSEIIYGTIGDVINVTGWWNGNENYTSDSQNYYITIEERSPLWNDTFGYLGSNISNPEPGDGVLLYGMAYDEVALNWTWLATNESSSWENKTQNYSSPANMSGSSASWTWSNFTWSNSSIPRGTIVGWKIYYNNSAGKENVTSIQTFTVATTTTTTTSTTTTTYGGGGGGGGSITLPKKHEKRMIFSKVTPGAASIMKITNPEIGLKQIKISVKNQARNVRITVTKLDDKPASVTHEISGKVYKYIEIGTNNLEEDNLEDAEIEFEVNKTWISNNNYDPFKVKLKRYLNGWQELKTELTDQDNDYYYYKAPTPGFSYFVITAEEEVEEEKTEEGPICGDGVCEEGETSDTCSSDCPKPTNTPSCGNGVCEEGEDCDSCSDDCPCAEGYICSDGICRAETQGAGKFPLKVIIIVVLIFVTLGVIAWLVKSLKEEHNLRSREFEDLGTEKKFEKEEVFEEEKDLNTGEFQDLNLEKEGVREEFFEEKPEEEYFNP
jgi:PGF-pre-PGF domain-containing protein